MDIKRWEISKAIPEYFMPYAMKTIVDRALPDVRDGLKPVHRRILYKMHENNMLSKYERVKSYSIVGEVLKIHPHGDASVYYALTKLTEQNESLLHPYLDGEGAFGKQYSTDKPSASRYTFARLNVFSENEMLGDIKKGMVKMIGSEKEHLQPTVLPVTFPNILIKTNEGIAVGMRCYFPSFNLVEVLTATIEYIKNNNIDLIKYIKAPDFSTGGQLLYNENQMKNIIENGKGKLRLRSKYRYNSLDNCIEVYEIPYNTTADAIVSQISDMMKENIKEIKDIQDIRDEIGFNKELGKEELMITIDVKKNTDVDKLMNYLFAKTNLEKSFTVSLNCLVDYRPQVLGIKGILNEWLKFRRDCIINSKNSDLKNKEAELHLLKGLEKVLLDIDKAIEIIRFTKKNQVIDKLCDYFKIDEIQAKAVTRISLGDINEEYIFDKIKDIQKFEDEIIDLRDYVSDTKRIDKDIIKQLDKIKSAYGIPRKTEILYNVQQIAVTEEIQDYNCMYYITKDNYLKKITLTSLRASGTEHKLKEGDEIIHEISGTNFSDILVFTDKGNCYKLKGHNISDGKVSALGVYLPSVTPLDKDENIVKVFIVNDYEGDILFAYENGKVARVSLKSYETKTNRTKLINALNLDSPLVNMFVIHEDMDLLCVSSNGRILIINTDELLTKASKSSQGIMVQGQKKDCILTKCIPVTEIKGNLDIDYYRGSCGWVGSDLKKGDSLNY